MDVPVLEDPRSVGEEVGGREHVGKSGEFCVAQSRDPVLNSVRNVVLFE